MADPAKEATHSPDLKLSNEVLQSLATCGIDAQKIRWCEECGYLTLHGIPEEKAGPIQSCLSEERTRRRIPLIYIRTNDA
ncbi:hypothetical protein [Alteriqipengyuania sp.]|uniref:hypothetical protein n=1 Tax=Alteriqipengyuania sp. TaxID=2800692 RepID=UPI003518BCB4